MTVVLSLLFYFSTKEICECLLKEVANKRPMANRDVDKITTKQDTTFYFLSFFKNFLFRDENYCEIKFKNSKKKGTPPDKHDSLHPLLFLSRHPSSACTDNPTTSTVNK